MFNTLALLQADSDAVPAAGIAAFAGIFGLIMFAVMLLVVASLWKIFVKAGEPGWAAIVPIYNIIVLLKIVGKPAWWLVLMIIPFVNFIVGIIVVFALAQKFGKSGGFAFGMLLLAPIFYPILAFGDSSYNPQA